MAKAFNTNGCMYWKVYDSGIYFLFLTRSKIRNLNPIKFILHPIQVASSLSSSHCQLHLWKKELIESVQAKRGKEKEDFPKFLDTVPMMQ